MPEELRDFLSRLAGAVVMTLAPVVFVAFLSLPLSLNRHPGEMAAAANPPYPHMT